MFSRIITFLIFITPLCIYGSETDSIPDSRVQNLKEVVVTPEEITQTQDKLIVNVSNQVKKHSYDGYSVLANLMLPGLEVDPFSSKVSAYNNGVLLAINGIKASKNEIKALFPKDIIRIDYYTGFNPEFPTAEYVIDFIVKIRDYGGDVMLQADQFLNRPTGKDFANWRMFSKQSEFSIRMEGDYHHFASQYGIGESIYDFSTGRVGRYQNTQTISNHDNNIRGSMNFLHRFKRGVLKASAAFTSQHRSNIEEEIDRIERLSGISLDTADIYTHSDRRLPSIQISYDHKFANKSTLSVSLNGDYTNTNASRDYLSEQTVMSHTRENFYSIRPRAKYTFNASKKNSLFAEMEMMYRNSKIEYIQNSDYTRPWLANIRGNFSIGDNFKVSNRLTLYLMARGVFGVNENSATTDKEFLFTPTARVTWKLPNGNQLQGQMSINSSHPALSMYSTDEKWLDPFRLRKGNPYLKSSVRYSPSITLTSNHRWGIFQFRSNYNVVTDAIYLDIMLDNERQMCIQTFNNGGDYKVLDISPYVQVNLIPNKLQFRTTVNYNRVDIHTYRHLHSDCVIVSGGMSYMNQGLNAHINFSSPRSSIDQYGEKYYYPIDFSISVGYIINNLSVNLYCKNPYMKTRNRIYMTLPDVMADFYSWRPRINDNDFAISVSYRFNYGKPKHKYENIEIEQTENTAILGH